MKWKILELAAETETAEALVDKILASTQFDIDKEEAWALLLEYRELLPEPVQNELISLEK